MGVPDNLLPHTVTLVRPNMATDQYGNTTYDYGPAAARTTIRGWLQQDHRKEPRSDGRDPLEQLWLLVTNHDDVAGRDRIEFDTTVYDVEGPPEKVYTPVGFHHMEATLRILSG